MRPSPRRSATQAPPSCRLAAGPKPAAPCGAAAATGSARPIGDPTSIATGSFTTPMAGRCSRRLLAKRFLNEFHGVVTRLALPPAHAADRLGFAGVVGVSGAKNMRHSLIPLAVAAVVAGLAFGAAPA